MTCTFPVLQALREQPDCAEAEGPHPVVLPTVHPVAGGWHPGWFQEKRAGEGQRAAAR